MYWAIPEKEKKNRGKGWGGGGVGGGLWTYFSENCLEFFIFLLYPWKFQTEQNSTPGNPTKLC